MNRYFPIVGHVWGVPIVGRYDILASDRDSASLVAARTDTDDDGGVRTISVVNSNERAGESTNVELSSFLETNQAKN